VDTVDSVGYNAVIDNKGLHSFVYIPNDSFITQNDRTQLHMYSSWCLPKSAKSREILWKFELIAVQGHPRSSILVPIESQYATSY